MAHDPAKDNDPPLMAPSLPPDHPLNDLLPVDIRALVSNMLELMGRIAALANHESKTMRSESGFYPITMLVNAKADVLCDEAGIPVLVRAPLDVLGLAPDGLPDHEGRRVVFGQPNQLVKRAEAAKLADTSVSTLKRAEANGELRAFKVGDRDTSYLMVDLNGWIFKRAMKGEGNS